MRRRLNKKNYVELFLLILITVVFSGCQKQVQQIPTTTEIETQETVKISSDDNTLEIVRIQIQDEMRVFDVVAYHDALYETIVAQSLGKTDDEMKPLIEKIVEEYMNNYLEGRIRDVLYAYNPDYPVDDATFIYEQIKTKDLYRLMVLYEHAFFIQSKGK